MKYINLIRDKQYFLFVKKNILFLLLCTQNSSENIINFKPSSNQNHKTNTKVENKTFNTRFV